MKQQEAHGRSSRWISREFAELLAQKEKWRDKPDAEQPSFDVLIVGSGYGGAVAAATLAAAGLSVCVLERGREYLPGAFPSRMADLATQVRGTFAGRVRGGEGLFDIRAGDDVGVVLASGLGGGSLINAGVMEIPRDEVLERFWPAAKRGGPEHSFYERAKRMLGATVAGGDNHIGRHAQHRTALPRKVQVLHDMDRARFRPAAITVAMTDKDSQGGVKLSACKLCGDCATGCNYGAKESLDTNLLVQAFRAGAKIYCGATVLRLARPNGRPDLWRVQVSHTDEKLRLREGKPLWITVRKVILAAGSLGSTEILLRSQRAPGGPLFSSMLGRKFSGNGDMLSFGYDYAPANAIADENQLPGLRQIGPTITGALDAEIEAGAEQRSQAIVIEEMAVPGPLRRFAGELIATADTIHALGGKDGRRHENGRPENDPIALNAGKLARTSIFAAMGDDGAGGSLCLNVSDDGLGDGQVSVVWPELKKLPLFDAQIRRIEELAKAAGYGGRTIPNPMWRLLPPSMEFLIGDQRGPLLTVHPLGGCAIGGSVNEGVVNEFGQVFAAAVAGNGGDKSEEFHDGLFVLDGSIVPTALSTNPALTIAALALRASERLCQPKPAACEPVVRPVVRSSAEIEAEIARWRERKPATAEFTERLSGPVRLKDADGVERECQVELTLTYDPLLLQDLFTPDADGRLCNAQLKLKAEPAADRPPRGRLRIFLIEAWRCLQREQLSGRRRERAEAAASISFALAGSLTILEREESSACARIRRAACAYLGNRGLRDLYQAWQDRKSASTKGSRNPLRDMIRLASHAGEVRLFRYELEIGSEILPKPGGDPVARFKAPAWAKDRAIRGHKRITYARPSNPWRQLMELNLDWFAGPIKGKPPPVLTLDPQYLAEGARPLFRIESQRDHQEALFDALSLGALFLRMLLSIHLWNARKPDRPRPREIARLPGMLPGLPPPEIVPVEVDRVDSKPVFARLTRYHRGNTGPVPVLMIHGYSASGTTFAHPALQPSLAQYLAQAGRDVWVADLRSSCGMPTATTPWTFERIALSDIPALVEQVCLRSGAEKIDVVAHCMGAAMFSMAVLSAGKDSLPAEILSERERDFEDRFRAQRRALPGRIKRAVLSQIGPVMALSQQNIFRAYVMSFFEQVLGPLSYRFRPEDGEGLASELLDRLLSTLPYPDDELKKENPTRPCARTEYAASRHRMDALYGGAFRLGNLSKQVLDQIDDFFGPLSLDTASQVIHFAGLRTITNRAGRNRFVTHESLAAHWKFPTLSIHGEQNALADVATVHHLDNMLIEAGRDFDFERLEGRGHQDCLIGENLLPVFIKVQEFLDGKRPPRAMRVAARGPSFRAEAPSLGPALMYDPNGKLCVSLGASPQLGIPSAYCVLPVMPRARGGWKIQESVLTPPAEAVFWNETKWNLRQDRATDWHSERMPAWAVNPSIQNAAVLLIYQQPDRMGVPFLDPALKLWGESAERIGQPSHDRRTERKMLAAVKRALMRMPPDTFALVRPPPWQDRDDTSLRIALGSCQYPPGILDEVPAYQSWACLNQRLDRGTQPPDLLILAGDQIYADATAGLFDPSQGDDRYRKPYERWLGNGEVRKALRRLPVCTLMDDHELDDNWEPLRAVAGGEAVLANERLRVDGVTGFLKYQRANWPGRPLWFPFEGKGVGLFVLDSRGERAPRAAGVDGAMLDADQLAELKTWLLKQDPDRPKIVVSPSVVLPRHRRAAASALAFDQADRAAPALRSDGWDGYPGIMNELLGFIAHNEIHNVIFLSGDEHLGLCATAQIKREGADTGVTVHSIHTPGLYTPYRFANAQRADFLLQDRYRFDVGAHQYSCAVDTAVYEGEGFTFVNLSKDAAGFWTLNCEFDDGSGRADRRRSVLLR